ncbi:MAG: TIGR00730 family Rossman fold protein [Planctomycetota bacterium]
MPQPSALAVCVYCSSSDAIDRAHFAVAEAMGVAIAERAWTLVWGGGQVGLMGAVARSAQLGGARVVGVIPESMTSVEIAYHDADELIVTPDMRTRKHAMDERSDAFVILPGGFGTLEELSEMMVQKVLGYTDRPIVLVNPDGFYDPLLTLFDHFVEQGFAKAKHLETLHVVTTVEEAVAVLASGLV